MLVTLGKGKERTPLSGTLGAGATAQHPAAGSRSTSQFLKIFIYLAAWLRQAESSAAACKLLVEACGI